MPIRAQSIVTPTHGRVLIREAASSVTLAGFHGYAQAAEDMMDALQQIPGSEAWTLISVQALNRFYTRGDQKIVASWMTRQDREEAIADNIEYVDRALEKQSADVFVLGFSQGVAMAYRAALLGKRAAAGIIAIGGDIPPDVKHVPAEKWPRVLIAAGTKDQWYTADKIAADETFLKSHGVSYEIFRHDEGHEITAAVRDEAARFVAAVS